MRLEEYLQRHSILDMTHGVCPDCMERVFGPDEAPSRNTGGGPG